MTLGYGQSTRRRLIIGVNRGNRDIRDAVKKMGKTTEQMKTFTKDRSVYRRWLRTPTQHEVQSEKRK